VSGRAGGDPPLILDGLRVIAADYDHFIIDQWGVVHDGHAPLPGALEVLAALRAAGKGVCLLSNSSRGLGPSRALLRRIGVEDDLYDAMVTSGALGEQALAARAAAGPLVALCLPGPPDPEGVVRGLGLGTTEDPAEATVLVGAGMAAAPPAEDDPRLRAAAERGLPMFCLNPDIRSMQPDGSFLFCAGAWAAPYAALGGAVQVWGKPLPEVYAASRAALAAAGFCLGRGLAIGDSLDHDIKGAEDNGLDALFISGGIEYEGNTDRPWGAPDPERLAAQLSARGRRPRASMGSLRW
jgi:HAD superfamily hydrolase (TIGR01459 family)